MTRTSARRQTPQPTKGAQDTETQPGMPAEPQPSAENSEEVRRQLKKTNLEEEQAMSTPQADEQPDREQGAPTAVTTNGEATTSDAEGRGRLRRKRSHEEVDVEALAGGEPTNNGKHARKRSKSGEPADTMADKPPSSQDMAKDPTVSGLAASQAENGATGAEDGPLLSRSQTPTLAEREEKDSTLLSPKNKRTRDQYLQNSIANEADEEEGGDGTAVSLEGSSKPAKRARDSNSPQPDEQVVASDAGETKEPEIPSTSGFANTSVTSPLANVASPKSPQTSASAFASSGFSTFASASASPFAAAGSAAGSASPFAGFGGSSTAPPAKGDSTAKPTSSVFGGPLNARAGNASPFATSGTPTLGSTTSSGFGGLGASSTSGFGGLSSSSAFGSGFAAVKPGAGLSSFATPGAVGITGLSNKPAKPFGAAVEDDEEADSDQDDEGDDEDRDPDAEEVEAGIKSPPTTLSAEKKDKRFKEQSIATGEENEVTVFTARGKLFINEDKQWKERGTGALKLNTSTADGGSVTDDDDGSVKTRARLLLRAEGTQRVVLNSPIQKDLTYGNVKGGKPTSTEHFQFPSFYEGRLQILLVKMKQQNKEELWEHIEALKKEI